MIANIDSEPPLKGLVFTRTTRGKGVRQAVGVNLRLGRKKAGEQPTWGRGNVDSNNNIDTAWNHVGLVRPGCESPRLSTAAAASVVYSSSSSSSSSSSNNNSSSSSSSSSWLFLKVKGFRGLILPRYLQISHQCTHR